MKTIRLPWTSFEAATVWGVLLWVALLVLQQPAIRHNDWAQLLLLLAALVWVPLSFSFHDKRLTCLQYLVFPAAACLVLSFQMMAGWCAAIWSLPWLLVTIMVFVNGVDYLSKARFSAGPYAVAAAQLFLIIGSMSILFDRFGIQPLGFDPAIVLLTGVHFHYAGFIFLLLLGWAAQQWPSPLFRSAAWLSIVAVPVTAIGITLSQVLVVFWVETFAASLVVCSGWLGALGYLQVVLQKQVPKEARLLWLIMAVSLFFSMTLSLGYAWRPYWPLEWINIPSMRAWHGTANALGVAGGGLLGWLFWHRAARKTNL